MFVFKMSNRGTVKGRRAVSKQTLKIEKKGENYWWILKERSRTQVGERILLSLKQGEMRNRCVYRLKFQ